MKNYFLFVIVLLFFSCDNAKVELNPEDKLTDETLEYSFFVAGHTYGSVADEFGLHPPFVKQIPFINSYLSMQLGVFTGDVVFSSVQADWDSAFVDLNKLNVPYHIAAGNHDRSSLFENIFGDYYYSFVHNEDLFIILSPTDWNIEGNQKEFLIETLDSNAMSVNNVFIFLHELVWWSPDNQFKETEINFLPHYPGSSNYWMEIDPILKNLSNEVIVFAGDLGASEGVSPYMHYSDENVTLMASGMGGEVEDNFIIVEVHEGGQLKIKLLGINATHPFEILDWKNMF